MCVSTEYSVLSRVLWKKISQAYYSGGIRTHDPCNSSYTQLDVKYKGIYFKLFNNLMFLFNQDRENNNENRKMRLLS